MVSMSETCDNKGLLLCILDVRFVCATYIGIDANGDQVAMLHESLGIVEVSL